MEKLKILNRIKELYLQNQNIIQYLKKVGGQSNASTEDILISYDFQAGSYTKYFEQNPNKKLEYCSYLAQIIDGLGDFDSILEAGVGEATTFGNILVLLKNKPLKKYGFDISWSRIKYALRFLKGLGIDDAQLFTGDLFCTPLKDNSIDIVYTSHSIEPNGGKEKEALCELYRITNKYLILLEPAYEFASEEAKKRMLEHGYITNLYDSAIELGFDVIEHRLFDTCDNPLNPTGLIIIKKDSDSKISDPICCPITKSNVIRKSDAYFSPDSLLAYPVVDQVPCLLPGNAIVAAHFLD